jgi:hypothetical protein
MNTSSIVAMPESQEPAASCVKSTPQRLHVRIRPSPVPARRTQARTTGTDGRERAVRSNTQRSATDPTSTAAISVLEPTSWVRTRASLNGAMAARTTRPLTGVARASATTAPTHRVTSVVSVPIVRMAR